jgi:hypothetical protein
VKKFQEALGYSPDILVAHAEDTEAGENDDNALGKFKCRDGAHTFDVRGIVDNRMRKMREFWMHLVKIDFRNQGMIADLF